MAAGNTMEQSVAMIAAANKVLQDPNSVGSALRTISLRLRGTSVEVLEELGEETDGAIESVSKLQEKVKGLTGVDILDASGGYKETYQILMELAEVWPKLNDMDRAGLLEMLAGKNRSNAMAALLTNAKDLKAAYEMAMGAEGSAMEENEKHLDSIKGKTELFTNALQSMWNNSLLPEMVKGVLDLGTALIKVVDTLGTIPTILTAIVAIGAFKTMLPTLSSVATAIGTLASESVKTGKSMSDLARETQIFADVSKSGFDGLKKSLASIRAFFKANPWVLAITAIAAVATGIVMANNKIKEAEAEAADAANKHAKELEETNDSIDTYKTRIDTLRKSLDEGNLSEEEAYNTRKQLMSIQDELIDKYGKEAEGINLVTGEINAQKAALDELSKAKMTEWLNQANESSGLFGLGKSTRDQAIEAATERRNASTSLFDTEIQGLLDSASEDIDIDDFIDDFRSQVEELKGSLNYDTSTGVINIGFSDQTRDELAANYDKLMAWLHNYANNNGVDLGSIIGIFSQGKSTFLGENYETQRNNLETYLEYTARTAYGDYHDQILKAQEDFNEAYAKNDIEAAREAQTRLLDSIAAAVKASSKRPDADLFKEWFEGMDDDLAPIFAEMDFEAAWNDVGGGLRSSIELALSTIHTESIAAQMKNGFQEAFDKGLDLTVRPKVSAEDMKAAGWEDVEDGDYATVHTVTALASEFGLADKDHDYAINLTPILPDGTVLGDGSGEEGFKNWISQQLESGQSLYSLGVFLGSYETIEEAEAAAVRLHELQELFYDDTASFAELTDLEILNMQNFADENGRLIEGVGGYTREQAYYYNMLVDSANQYGMTLDQLIAKLVQWGYIQGSTFIEPPTFKIDKYAEDIDKIQSSISSYQSALESLRDGSFTMNDLVELIQKFPELAKGVDLSSKSFKGLTKNLRSAMKAAPDDLIAILEDLKGELKTEEEKAAVQQLINALQNLDAQDFTSLMDNLASLQEMLTQMGTKQGELQTTMNLDPNPLYDTALEAQRSVLEQFEKGLTGQESPIWDTMRSLYGDSTINSILSDTGTTWAEKVQSAYEKALEYDRWFPQDDDPEGLYNATSNFMNDIEARIKTNAAAARLLEDAGATWKDGVLDLPNYLIEDLAEALQIDPALFTALVNQVAQYEGILLEDARDISYSISEILEDGSDNYVADLALIQDAMDHLFQHYGQEQIDWNEILNKQGLSGLETEIRERLERVVDSGLLDELINNYSALLEQAFPEALKNTGLSNDTLAKLSAGATQSGDGKKLFVDSSALDEVISDANDATDAIEQLKDAVGNGDIIALNKTETDPLGLQSLMTDVDNMRLYLQSLGVEINNLGSASESIDFSSLVATLSAAKYDADEIVAIAEQLRENGLNIDIKGELNAESVNAQIEKINSGVETNEVNIAVNLDIPEEAVAKIQEIVPEIEKLQSKTADVIVNTNVTDDMITDLSSVNDEINVIKSVTESVTITADVRSVIDDLKDLNKELSNLDNAIGNGISVSVVDLAKLQIVQNKVSNIYTRLDNISKRVPLEIDVNTNYDEVMGSIKEINDLLDSMNEKISAIGSLQINVPKAETPELETEKTTRVSTEVDTSKLETANGLLASLEDKEVKISIDDQASGPLENIIGLIDAIKSKRVQIIVDVVPNDPLGLLGGGGGSGSITTVANGTANASGTAHASGDWGLPKAEKKALVGELGQETVVDPNTGRYYTVGDNGAEFVDLPKGAIIFNHKQTEQLFKHGYVTGRGKAVASGTAFASGSAFASGGYGSGWNSVSRNGHKKGSGSGSGSGDDFEETIDWFEILLEEINEQLDLMNAKLENAVGISAKKSLIGQLLDTNHYELGKLAEGVKLYTDYAAELLKDVPQQYREAVQNGAVDISEFLGEANEATVEAINNYRDWAQKIAETQQQLEEVKATISDLRVEALEMINTEYENEIGLITVVNDRIEDTIDLLEEQGARVSSGMYEELISNTTKQLQKLQEQRNVMQKEFDEAVASGDIKKYSEDWYDMLNSIYDVDSAIIEAKTSLEEFDNAILELHWDNFEKIIDSLDMILDESEQIRDVIRDIELTDDAGNWTKEGITALGMAAQEMENAKYRADLYGEQIEVLNKQFAEGKYSQDEYREKLQELKENQWDAIDSYESAKDALVDLNKTRIQVVKDGLQKEIDAYEELIQKRKEDLNSQKEAYDWENQVKDHADEIDRIQRQIDAMEGDNSAAAVAQRKKLEEELANAQEELDRAYYDRDITLQQESLDKSLEAYRKEKEDRMEELDEYLKKEDQVISDSYALILANTESVSAGLQEIANRYNISISESVVSPWEAGASALGVYGEELDYATSTYVDMLERVRKELIDIQVQADKTASSLIKDINTSAQNTQGNTTKPATSTPAPAVQPSLANGAQVTVKKTATNFARDGGNGTLMQSWVPGSTFTVYQVDGDQVLLGIPGQGYTGWVKKKDLVGYAKGTTGVKKDQLAWIDENGLEEIVLHANNGRLSYLTMGSAVIPGDISSNLIELGKVDYRTILDNNRPSVSAPGMIENKMQVDMTISELIHIEHADRDSIPEINDAVKKQLDSYMKQLNSGIKKYSR